MKANQELGGGRARPERFRMVGGARFADLQGRTRPGRRGGRRAVAEGSVHGPGDGEPGPGQAAAAARPGQRPLLADQSAAGTRTNAAGRTRLAEIRAPVLVLVGSRDVPDIQAIVKRIEKDVPHARKVVIRDAGHMVNMEKPEEFNREVLEFLRKGS